MALTNGCFREGQREGDMGKRMNIGGIEQEDLEVKGRMERKELKRNSSDGRMK